MLLNSNPLYIFLTIAIAFQLFSSTTLAPHSSSTKYTILWATANQIFKMQMLNGRSPPEVVLRLNDYTNVANITSLAVHVDKNLLFFGETSGLVRRVNLTESIKAVKTFFKGRQPQLNLSRINQLTVDWLNNHLYIVSDSKISRCDLEGNDFRHLIVGFDEGPERAGLYGPKSVQVDPINGYLFWSLQGAERGGIYRSDLADLRDRKEPLHYQEVPIVIREPDISAFTMDYNAHKLFFPRKKTTETTPNADFDGSHIHDDHSSSSGKSTKESRTVIVAVRDGKHEEVIRDEEKVVTSKYGTFKDIIYVGDRFWWTDGIQYFAEECPGKGDQRCYHNEFHFPQVSLGEVVAILFFEKSLQPVPIPVTPVKELSVTLSNTQGFVKWNVPPEASHQGKGAYKDWFYELEIADLRLTNTITTSGLKTTNTIVKELNPNTNYTFRVRATSSAGYGPWSSSVTEKTNEVHTLPSGPPNPPALTFDQLRMVVSWKKAQESDNDADSYELDIKASGEETWRNVYNGTSTFWFVQRLLDGRTYDVRVRARNIFGISQYREDHFYYPVTASSNTLLQPPRNEYLVAIFTSMVVFFAAFLALICFLTSVKKNDKGNSLNELKRGVNELVPLPELPAHPHQSNILYSNSLNVEDELTMVPRVGRDQIELMRELGNGAFGTVYEGYVHKLWGPHSPKTKVAVKTLKPNSTESERKDFIREAKIMGNFNHPNILRLLAICVDSHPNCLILELMEGGDLLKYLRTHRPTSSNPYSLNDNELLKICIDVTKGCKYLEDMHFVHRDLACRNCLVSSSDPNSRVVKIGDFGLTRDVYRSDYYRRGKQALLPIRWMPPESISDGVFTTHSDVWSFGVLLWEVFSLGQRPYYGRENNDVIEIIRTGGILPRPERCPEDIYTLMKLCWSIEPEQRPSFAMCLQRLESLMTENRYSGSSSITSVHNKSYLRNDLLTRKTCHSQKSHQTNSSIDEGIESAATTHPPLSDTCTSPLPSFLKDMSGQDSFSNMDSSGYERPIEVTGAFHANRLRQPIRHRSHSHCTDTSSRLGSCPPTYSQIFATSRSASSCTQIQTHPIATYEVIEGGDELLRKDKSSADDEGNKHPAAHSYVNDVITSSEMLRNKIAAPGSRSLNILSKVNETFPKNPTRFLDSPDFDQENHDFRTSSASTWTSLDHASLKESLEEEKLDQDFYNNGYKVPLVKREQISKHNNNHLVHGTKETNCRI